MVCCSVFCGDVVAEEVNAAITAIKTKRSTQCIDESRQTYLTAPFEWPLQPISESVLSVRPSVRPSNDRELDGNVEFFLPFSCLSAYLCVFVWMCVHARMFTHHHTSGRNTTHQFALVQFITHQNNSNFISTYQYTTLAHISTHKYM